MGVSRSRYILHLFIIHFFSCLGWLCNLAFALVESSETISGSANFPDLGFAILGNFMVFITSLLRGRLDLELGARDVLATLRGPKLYPINAGFGWTTCEESPEPENRFAKASVVMLSYNQANSSMKQFMKYICNAYKVHSILLQCFPLKSQSAKLLPGICNCKLQDGKSECNCIVFWNVQDIVKVLDQRMPGSLKRLSDSLCLLPSPGCLKNGCHGCTEDQFSLEEIDESRRKKGKKAVDEIFEYVSQGAMEREHPCICIPLSPSGYDYWTKLLNRSFGATGESDSAYSTASLIVPRLTEIALNLVLTVWFRVDGFSSSLVARRAIKDYVVDSKGSGFAAGAFLTNGNAQNNNQCRVLNFRGTRLGVRTLSYIVGSFNVFCSILWVLFVSLQPTNIGKWYDVHSASPSKSLVVVAILVGIGIALGMDCLHLYLIRDSGSKPTVKVDEPKEPTSTVSQEATTGKGLFAPIINVWRRVKLWFQRMLQFCLPLLVCIHPMLQFWGRLKVCLHPILQFWGRLKVCLHPILQFWGRLKVRDLILQKARHLILQFWRPLKVRYFPGGLRKTLLRPKVLVGAVMALELICILCGSLLLGILGPKCFGRWVYGALQVLVWVKWATGSYLLGEYPPEYDSQSKDENGILVYSSAFTYDNGILVYSSAFWLNALLAGVRFHWHYATDLNSLN